MGVFALLDRVAAIVGRVHQLAREARRHRRLGPAARGRDQPADRERLGAFRTDLDRDLVGRTADAARTHLDLRLHVVQRIVEQRDRIGLRTALDHFEGTVDDTFGNGLLTVEHEVVHELRQDLIPELGIGQDFPLLGTTTT